MLLFPVVFDNGNLLMEEDEENSMLITWPLAD